MSAPGRALRATYDERLLPSPAWWALVVAFGVGVTWSFLLAVPPWFALVAGVLVLGGLAAVLVRAGSARVAVLVDEGGDAVLVAGRARLPVRHAGEPEPLDADAARHLLGAGADVRAHLLMRPWVRTAVRVPVHDDGDPTPYWVVATRRPEQLAAALRAARAHLTD